MRLSDSRTPSIDQTTFDRARQSTAQGKTPSDVPQQTAVSIHLAIFSLLTSPDTRNDKWVMPFCAPLYRQAQRRESAIRAFSHCTFKPAFFASLEKAHALYHGRRTVCHLDTL